MSVRILSGQKINEENKDGAVLYDSCTGLAYGPVFKSAEEAEAFISFASYVKLEALCWDTDDFGQLLYGMWLKEGKPSKRAVKQFKMSDLSTYKDPIDDWGFLSCSMVEMCFPLFRGYNNNEIMGVLRKAGVTAGCQTDSESSCFDVFFKTEQQAKDFLDRLNAWLRDNWHSAYGVEV